MLHIIEELASMLDKQKSVEDNIKCVEARLSLVIWSMLKMNWEVLDDEQKYKLIEMLLKEKK